MASFRFKKIHIFPTPVHSTLNLKMLPLHSIPEISYAEKLYTGLIIRAKSCAL